MDKLGEINCRDAAKDFTNSRDDEGGRYATQNKTDDVPENLYPEQLNVQPFQIKTANTLQCINNSNQ